GLHAQTAMRIEKGYRAMGHELDGDVTPLEAGLDFAVAWDSRFIGREALLRRRDAALKSRVATVVFDDTQPVPLGSEPVYAEGWIVGKTTSAGFGYRIGKPVALVYLDAGVGEGDPVEVDIARRFWPGRVTLRPAFDPAGARMRPT
ncbi:MAG TPA: glycine cleavage T C-terminal barrel domain-containing protein, partial [Thermohalobaculum sp.]|nr:glycine cleavage T C-terminal barrel domain-containing protein [Thermohalobaculum sp.]